MSLLACSGCSTRYASGLERCPHCGSGERVEEGGGGSRLPSLDVACGNEACPAFATVRRVYLRCPVPGVVEMPYLLRCSVCWSAMPALGGSMEEDIMPKITRHGGATNAAALPEQVATPGEALPELPESAYPPDAVPLDKAGKGEPPSAGSSSETSSEKPPTSSEPSDPVLPKRARTTASRSGKGRTGSSTARSTGSSTEADEAS